MSYTPPPPPPQPGPGGYGYATPQQNQKALWSMILGILSLICCGVVVGIVAIVLGNSAKKEIAASGGMQTGEGMAKAGVIMGWIGIALTILYVILAVTGALTIPGTSSSGY
jgi:uncharacterized membrane protein